VTVEIGASGWKSQAVADSNGHYSFGGLCEGMAYVKLLLPEGSLPTNPNAEAVLDGKNVIQVDLGFFPPAPTMQAEISTGEPAPVVSIPVPAAPQILPAQEPVLLAQPTAEGISVEVSAPGAVRAGLAAKVTISVKNTGRLQVGGVEVLLSLPSDAVLEEANTSRGALKLAVARPGGWLKPGGLNIPLRAQDNSLVVQVGTLAAGEVAVISAQLKFKDNAALGVRTDLRAEVRTEGKSYLSQVIPLTLKETGGAFQVALPTTGDSTYAQYLRDFLW
jgi:hypothetical protein